jgi:hypothetical protein
MAPPFPTRKGFGPEMSVSRRPMEQTNEWLHCPRQLRATCFPSPFRVGKGGALLGLTIPEADPAEFQASVSLTLSALFLFSLSWLERARTLSVDATTVSLSVLYLEPLQLNPQRQTAPLLSRMRTWQNVLCQLGRTFRGPEAGQSGRSQHDTPCMYYASPVPVTAPKREHST